MANDAPYFHLTNLSSPVDETDGNFLNTLADYRLGPPQATEQKSQKQLVLDGVMGIYTTEDAMLNLKLRTLTGFDLLALSFVRLGE